MLVHTDQYWSHQKMKFELLPWLASLYNTVLTSGEFNIHRHEYFWPLTQGHIQKLALLLWGGFICPTLWRRTFTSLIPQQLFLMRICPVSPFCPALSASLGGKVLQGIDVTRFEKDNSSFKVPEHLSATRHARSYWGENNAQSPCRHKAPRISKVLG